MLWCGHTLLCINRQSKTTPSVQHCVPYPAQTKAKKNIKCPTLSLWQTQAYMYMHLSLRGSPCVRLNLVRSWWITPRREKEDASGCQWTSHLERLTESKIYFVILYNSSTSFVLLSTHSSINLLIRKRRPRLELQYVNYVCHHELDQQTFASSLAFFKHVFLPALRRSRFSITKQCIASSKYRSCP
jgi:hypothetical protein